MHDLLLDDEDYIEALVQIKQFAQDNNVEMKLVSADILRTIAAMLITIDLNQESLAMLVKVVYNLGYRDNRFVNLPVH
jgi:hypothetical protein